jgi:hypothetical protein
MLNLDFYGVLISFSTIFSIAYAHGPGDMVSFYIDSGGRRQLIVGKIIKIEGGKATVQWEDEGFVLKNEVSVQNLRPTASPRAPLSVPGTPRASSVAPNSVSPRRKTPQTVNPSKKPVPKAPKFEDVAVTYHNFLTLEVQKERLLKEKGYQYQNPSAANQSLDPAYAKLNELQKGTVFDPGLEISHKENLNVAIARMHDQVLAASKIQDENDRKYWVDFYLTGIGLLRNTLNATFEQNIRKSLPKSPSKLPEVEFEQSEMFVAAKKTVETLKQKGIQEPPAQNHDSDPAYEKIMEIGRGGFFGPHQYIRKRIDHRADMLALQEMILAASKIENENDRSYWIQHYLTALELIRTTEGKKLEQMAQSLVAPTGKAEPQYQSPSMIPKDQCMRLQFDNQSLMAPERNQHSSPFCAGHAVAGLLEEQLCLAERESQTSKNPPTKGYCGEHVSRTEIMAKGDPASRSLADIDGISSPEALEYFVQEGQNGGNYRVCLDKYAKNLFDKGRDGATMIRELKEFYRQSRESAGSSVCQDPVQFDQVLRLDHNLAQVNALLNEDRSRWTVQREKKPMLRLSDFQDILRESKDYGDFVNRVLLSYCTENDKKSFRREGVTLTAEREYFDPDPRKGKISRSDVKPEAFINFFSGAVQSGHSLVLSVCYKQMARKAECGNHAVVLNGIQWDDKSNRCKLHITNSHGENARVLKSNWYSAEQILPYTFRSTYLRKN